MNPGDIIFLTRRKFKHGLNYRWVLSNIIALISKKDSINNTKVHASIIYKDNGISYVRDMGIRGNSNLSFDDYMDIYKDRMEIKKNSYYSSNENLFNISCKTLSTGYDYFNLLLWQPLKRLFGKYKGKNTELLRICNEDVERQFNILIPGFFKNLESNDPQGLYDLIKNWKTVNE